MILSKKTIRLLAEMICGAHGSEGFHWDNFIYRTSSQLIQFFEEDCELSTRAFGSIGTRVYWVVDILTELNKDESTLPKVIVALLESIRREKNGTFNGAIGDVNVALNDSCAEIKYSENKYTFNISEDLSTRPTISFSSTEKQATGNLLFKKQFPVGLPFGVSKPDFAVLAQKDTQSLGYKLKNGLWILQVRDDIYPDFTFQKLEQICNIEHNVNKQLKKSLINMNQTEREKKFFIEFGKTFDMANSDVPLLLPQAWIQWHSQTKEKLREEGSKIANEPQRIDFVAFWNNQRYAILVDDIGHYAQQDKNGTWIASEEKYSSNLREERKFRREGWNIFRVSNWEVIMTMP